MPAPLAGIGPYFLHPSALDAKALIISVGKNKFVCSTDSQTCLAVDDTASCVTSLDVGDRSRRPNPTAALDLSPQTDLSIDRDRLRYARAGSGQASHAVDQLVALCRLR
jgi:hypothetical protein